MCIRDRVLLGEGADAEPRVFYKWADCERLAAAQRRRLSRRRLRRRPSWPAPSSHGRDGWGRAPGGRGGRLRGA
eukprot:10420992-Alexandrium_andersonii.AAC.1